MANSSSTKAEKAKNAALARISRIKAREEETKNGAYGLGAAYFASRYYGRRVAEAEKGERERAGFELMGMEFDGTQIGAVSAIGGALGVLGDDTYDAVLYASGVAVLAADQAITSYTEKLAEPPA